MFSQRNLFNTEPVSQIILIWSLGFRPEGFRLPCSRTQPANNCVFTNSSAKVRTRSKPSNISITYRKDQVSSLLSSCREIAAQSYILPDCRIETTRQLHHTRRTTLTIKNLKRPAYRDEGRRTMVPSRGYRISRLRKRRKRSRILRD